MDQDDHGGGKLEGALDHLARTDRGVIDGAGLLAHFGGQEVARVEKSTRIFPNDKSRPLLPRSACLEMFRCNRSEPIRV